MVGLAEDTDSATFLHTIKMLDWGKRFNVHLRRNQLKTPHVSGDPRTWCWYLYPLVKVASTSHFHCRDKDMEDNGTRVVK